MSQNFARGNAVLIGPTGGDLGGTYPNPIVIALQGNAVLSQSLGSLQDGYILSWDGSYWEAIPPASTTPTGPAGGDLSGTYPDPLVVALSGNPLQIISLGAAQDGYVLTWKNGAGLLEFLPTSDIISLLGDVTGVADANTVIAIQGNAVQAGTNGSAQDGYVLTWKNSSSQWQAKPPSDAISLIGDVTGAADANTVVALRGNALQAITLGATQDGYALTWNNTAGLLEFTASVDALVLSGDVTGAADANTVVNIHGTSVPASPSANQVLVATSSTSSTWQLIANAEVSATAAIDYSKLNLTGDIVNADINSSAAIAYSKLNLTGDIVNADINSSAAIAYSKLNLTGDIVNADIATAAAIAGTKISPNFGSQNILTTGTLGAGASTLGATNVSSLQDTAFSSAGVVHNDASGNFTSSLIVNADVSASAAIVYSKLSLTGDIVNADISTSAAVAVSKLAAGTSAQILQNNGTPTPTWTTVSGDVTITNTGVTTVGAIQGIVISGTPQDGYVLEATSSSAASWQSPSGDITLAGDVTGAANANTVVNIHGTSVPASPSANQVLVATSGTVSIWSQIYDGYVASAAAIAGTKISPNFGSQNILTTGTLGAGASTLGATNVSSLKDTAFSSAGVVHNDASGNFTSSLVVNADVSSSAAIAVSKLAAGTSAQILQNNGTPTPTWTTISGDVSITNAGVTTVTALQGYAVANTAPTTNYVLTWNGSIWTPLAGSTVTWSNDLAGSTINNQYVAAISGNAGGGGSIPLNCTALAFATGQSNPSLVQTTLSDTVGFPVNAHNFSINAQSGQSLSGVGSGSGETGGTGGNLTVNAGNGGSLTTAFVLNTSTAGNGGTLTIQAGNGGSCISSSLTSTVGGNGGNLILSSGALGTGNTNGTAGNILLETGGTTRLTVNQTGVITIANLGTGVVHADSSGNLTSSTIVDADVSASAAIAVSKLAAGTNSYVLTTVSGVPTWAAASGGSFTAGGDLSGSSSSQQVISITGSSGTVAVASTGNIITWAAATTAPGIKQTAAAATNTPAAGANMTIAAQAGTAAASGNNNGGNGANLILNAGAGGAKTGSGTAGTGGKVVVGGGQNVVVGTAITSNYTVLASDFIINVGTLTGSITVTLPSSPTVGDMYIVKDVNGTCCSTTGAGLTSNGYQIILDPGSGSTIDVYTHTYPFLMSVPYMSITLVYTGSSNWAIL